MSTQSIIHASRYTPHITQKGNNPAPQFPGFNTLLNRLSRKQPAQELQRKPSGTSDAHTHPHRSSANPGRPMSNAPPANHLAAACVALKARIQVRATALYI